MENFRCIPGAVCLSQILGKQVHVNKCLARYHGKIPEQILIASTLFYLYHELLVKKNQYVMYKYALLSTN